MKDRFEGSESILLAVIVAAVVGTAVVGAAVVGAAVVGATVGSPRPKSFCANTSEGFSGLLNSFCSNC